MRDAWAALERPLVHVTRDPARGRELLGEFMAMGQSHDPDRGQLLWGYQHVDTRRYLFLGDAGDASHDDARSGRYVPLLVHDARARTRAATSPEGFSGTRAPGA